MLRRVSPVSILGAWENIEKLAAQKGRATPYRSAASRSFASLPPGLRAAALFASSSSSSAAWRALSSRSSVPTVRWRSRSRGSHVDFRDVHLLYIKL